MEIWLCLYVVTVAVHLVSLKSASLWRITWNRAEQHNNLCTGHIYVKVPLKVMWACGWRRRETEVELRSFVWSVYCCSGSYSWFPSSSLIHKLYIWIWKCFIASFGDKHNRQSSLCTLLWIDFKTCQGKKRDI